MEKGNRKTSSENCCDDANLAVSGIFQTDVTNEIVTVPLCTKGHSSAQLQGCSSPVVPPGVVQCPT